MSQTRVQVGIIGMGQGGKALAAHLASRGYKPLVYCCPGHRTEYNFIKENNSRVEASHAVEGVFEVQLVDDLSDFVRRTTHIIIVTLSTAHREILQALSKYDLRRTTIVALPGGGTFAAKVRQLGLETKNTLESCTLPYASRCPAPGQVAVLYIKKTFPLASVKVMQERDRLILSEVFDGRVEWRKSVLNMWLNCTNPVVHCPPIIFNAGRVESGNPFSLYGEGITPSVARATMALDAERIAIATSNGEHAPTVLDWTNIWYDANYPDWVTFAQSSTPHNKHGLAPTTLKGQRFLDEDMKETMVMWYCLGRLRGLDLPVMRSMITLASAMVDEDYFVTGSTLESLGLDKMSPTEIMNIFGTPEPQPVVPQELRLVKMAVPASPTACRPALSPELRHFGVEPLFGMLAFSKAG
ncbi:hypothetical protein N0V93_001888 [Gnomoniopsis smithogilvyi]|uniref:Opine dehydrogenase domain-containing protein n=1 Tax=Gnomoniopsis smithogilvyi TaxID=1191159 RepID=A0A9W9D317_9PEZI|nr:hypothetical protein N0V93_001888 [Gnomoniopsis smithogilvyi]